MGLKTIGLLLMLFTLSGCGDKPIAEDRPKTGNIVFLGDSITRGYEVEENERFTALLADKLSAHGFAHYSVVNQGVDGDKTSDGLARLEAVLAAEPEIVVLALGGNDFLRSRPLTELATNLQQIIERLQAEKIEVILVGVSAPPFKGFSYSSGAKQMYESIAETYELEFMPNILKGMVLDQRFMQTDNIHPTVLGHERIAENLWPYLEDRLRAN